MNDGKTKNQTGIMKRSKAVLFAAIAGALALAATKTMAFPLYLKSFNGTLSVTPSFSAISSTNKVKLTKVSFKTKDVINFIIDRVGVVSGTNAPSDVQVVYDAYLNQTYLTNSSGYYRNLSGIANTRIYDIGAAWNSGNSSGSENDVALLFLDVYGYDSNDDYYEFEVYGQGTLKYSGNDKKVTMTLKCSNGSDYGEYQSSDDGVCRGSFTFSGSTDNPEWSGPFAPYWWD
jgi:hypothetical protein